MNIFSKFTICFSQTVKGVIKCSSDEGELPFGIEFRARGAIDPRDGREIAGTVNIPGRAHDRPLLGTLTRRRGVYEMAFNFNDDQFQKHSFKCSIAGSMVFGEAAVKNGSITGDGEKQQWAQIISGERGPSSISISSLRIERRPTRPIYKDRLKSILDAESAPFPMRSIAVMFAEAAFPAGESLPGGGEEIIQRMENSIVVKIKAVRLILRLFLMGIERLPRLAIGKGFSEMGKEERAQWLENMKGTSQGMRGLILRAAIFVFNPLFIIGSILFKYFHINTPEAHSILLTAMQVGGDV